MNSLVYHGVDYSIPKFVEEFTTELPLVAQVTSGSTGCGYEISADEVYWISGIQRQERVVVKEVSTLTGQPVPPRFLSIPIDYPSNFQMVKDKRNKKLGPGLSLDLLMRETKTCPAPHLIVFENSNNVSFTIGGQKNRTDTFGIMEIVDTYRQKYLVGYPITDNSLHPKSEAIPTFMDITLDVAHQAKGKSHTVFRQWIEDIKEMTTSFGPREAPMYNEIVQFNEIPDSGHYEYMCPKKYFVRNPGLSRSVSTKDRHPPYTPLTLDGPEVPRRAAVSLPPRYNSLPSSAPPPRPPGREPQKKRLPPFRPPLELPITTIQHISEVPSDLDVGRLTVDEVAHCLCLLGMWRHAGMMKERMVDGTMLLLLDEATLVQDFNFTDAYAAQLIRFTSGWRPKTI